MELGMLNQSFISGISHAWSWYMTILMSPWILASLEEAENQ